MKKLTKDDIMKYQDKQELQAEFQNQKNAYKKAKESLEYAQDVVEEQEASDKMHTARANVKLIKQYIR